MAWIRTVPLEDADESLLKAMADQRSLYPAEYAQPVQELDQGLPGIVASHTLIPQALSSCVCDLRRPDVARPAARAPAARDDRHHGLADQQVPLLNCLARRVSASGHPGRRSDPGAAEDYTKAPITEAERVMVDYVVKLTKDATKVSPVDHDRLRAAGFDDRAILQITLIASWFNYINRVADALGVGRE